MKEKALGEKDTLRRKHHSLAAKTFHATLLGCVLLGVVALAIGLGFYGYALIRQSASHAFDVANCAAMPIRQSEITDDLSGQVMEIYRGLSDSERDRVGASEYRALFDAVDTGYGSDYGQISYTLRSFAHTADLDDVYLAVIDEATGAMVYIVDPVEEGQMFPGDWEPMSANSIRKFLDWDGEGILCDFDHTEKYGWMCTAGMPIRDRENDSIMMFVFADVTLGNVLPSLRVFALQMGIALLVATALIALWMAWRMKRTIVGPINTIADAAVSYARDKRAGATDPHHFADLDIHTRDELENLSRVMADMERDLAAHEADLTRVTAEKERIGAELSLATRIQAAMLPHTFPPFPDRHEFDIFASMRPARWVGGDFYDFFMIDDDHLALVIADVSGKGVPAALFMMASMIMLRSLARTGIGAAEILTRTNATICGNNQMGLFVTVWLGILEISTGRLTAANAGHEYPALRRANSAFRLYRDPHSLVVGGMEGVRYKEYTIDLEAGDTLFLYTDGIAEANDANEAMFGTQRMIDALNIDPDAGPEALVARVQGAADAFVGDAGQFDDMTMMCVKFRG